MSANKRKKEAESGSAGSSGNVSITGKVKNTSKQYFSRAAALYALIADGVKRKTSGARIYADNIKGHLLRFPADFSVKAREYREKVSGKFKKSSFTGAKAGIAAGYDRLKSSARKAAVSSKAITEKLKVSSDNLLTRIKTVRPSGKKAPEKIKVKTRPETGKRLSTLKKSLYFSLIGVFSILLILAVVFGVSIYRQYQEKLLKTEEIIEAQRQYDVKNFGDAGFNHIEVTGSRDIKPGQTIELKVYFKNTGLLTADDFRIIFTVPENVELIESSISDHEHSIEADSVILYMGDLPPNSGSDLDIGFRANSPLPDGTRISVPDLKFIYVKEAPLIGKKDIFNSDINSEEYLTVFASPDFSQSAISIEDQGDGNEQNTVTYGETIFYLVEIINSGDMDAENASIVIKNLDNLVLFPEENPEFIVADGTATINIDSLRAGDMKAYKLVTHVDEASVNDSIILPRMEVTYSGNTDEFEPPERIVKLYPGFDGSSVFISARGTGGVYSGDVIDVTVNVKNTGNIEATNVIAELVYSNLFALEQGEASWNIEKLDIGESVSFNTSLKIVAELDKDTKADCSLNILSDGIPGVRVSSSSILISGEKPFTRNMIPIIALHGIEPEPIGRYELSTGQFDALCGTLKAQGYKTVTLADLLAFIEGRKQLPEKPVIITSDDGYQSMYNNAFPILQKYGYRMTIFLVTGLIGNSNEDRHLNDFDSGRKGIPVRSMLIWPEVVAMSKYGIEFQSHTVNHRSVGELPGDAAYFEMAQSKADIESHTGKPCVFIAWPHGNYTGSVLAALPGIGYRGALRYGGGVEDIRSINIFELKRIPFYQEISPSSYASIMRLD